jgi:hypothetical protein
MDQYRRTLSLDPGRDYFYVNMGPVSDGSDPSRYAFPTDTSAVRFAETHKRLRPEREIAVDYPDGSRRGI